MSPTLLLPCLTDLNSPPENCVIRWESRAGEQGKVKFGVGAPETKGPYDFV